MFLRGYGNPGVGLRHLPKPTSAPLIPTVIGNVGGFGAEKSGLSHWAPPHLPRTWGRSPSRHQSYRQGCSSRSGGTENVRSWSIPHHTNILLTVQVKSAGFILFSHAFNFFSEKKVSLPELPYLAVHSTLYTHNSLSDLALGIVAPPLSLMAETVRVAIAVLVIYAPDLAPISCGTAGGLVGLLALMAPHHRHRINRRQSIQYIVHGSFHDRICNSHLNIGSRRRHRHQPLSSCHLRPSCSIRLLQSRGYVAAPCECRIVCIIQRPYNSVPH